LLTAQQGKLLSEAEDGVAIGHTQGERLGFFARQFSDRDLFISFDESSEA
jgi:hypothetical protein